MTSKSNFRIFVFMLIVACFAKAALLSGRTASASPASQRWILVTLSETDMQLSLSLLVLFPFFSLLLLSLPQDWVLNCKTCCHVSQCLREGSCSMPHLVICSLPATTIWHIVLGQVQWVAGAAGQPVLSSKWSCEPAGLQSISPASSLKGMWQAFSQ